jgi:methionyl-tRNA formyltransferase
LGLRIVFAGTPIFASNALLALLNRRFNVIAVYTQPDRPAGRGMKLTPSPVKTLALEHGIAVLQPASLKSVEAQAELAALKPDLMIVAAYGLILPQAVLDIPRLGCLNIHASLLPRWRGAAPIHRAILAGDTESGVCIMRMEAGLDTGPVLLEKRTPIAPDETTGSLHDRLALLGADAVVAVVERLAAGEKMAELTQPTDGVTYASKITPEEAKIDWRAEASQIDRQVRAFNPAPGAWTTSQNEKLKIWRARVVANEAFDMSDFDRSGSGTVVVRGGELWVACGDENHKKSVLAIDEIQRAGGKRIATSAWLRGADAANTGDRLAE